MNNNTFNERIIHETRLQFVLSCLLVFAATALPLFAVSCLGQLMENDAVNLIEGSVLAGFFAVPVALLYFGFGHTARKAALKHPLARSAE